MATSWGDSGFRSVPKIQYAPIAIFTYNRPAHVKVLLDNLMSDPGFLASPVFVYCDGPRKAEHREAVAENRSVVHERLRGFGNIIESEQNKGLAGSIIGGVSELCERYGRAIVIEDDLILAPGWLEFLNGALEHYENQDRVFHVNAYRYPMPATSKPYFSRLTSSWGWATWQRAWTNFETDAAELERRIQRSNAVSQMNFGGAFPYFRMLQNQARGEIDSWAIRWYASTLLCGGLAVCPNTSLTANFGFDGTGVHCAVNSDFDVELGVPNYEWPEQLSEDLANYHDMQAFFRGIRGTIPQRAVRKLKRLLSAS